MKIKVTDEEKKWLDDLEKSGRRLEYAHYLQQMFLKYKIKNEPNTDFTYDFETGEITSEPRMN
jgi:hypothetical protein